MDKILKDARRASRHRHDSALEILDHEGGEPTAAVRLVDVSAGGLSFTSAGTFAKGARIRARLRLLGVGVLVVIGTIVRVKEKTNSSLYAVEFDTVLGKRDRRPT